MRRCLKPTRIPPSASPIYSQPLGQPMSPDPGRTDPGRTDPGRMDPGRTMGRTDPGRTDPGHTDPGHTDPGLEDGRGGSGSGGESTHGKPLRAAFLFGDSHAGGFALAMRSAVEGKMAFAGVRRGTCGWSPFPCERDDEAATKAFQDEISAAMTVELWEGDVVVLLRMQNRHVQPDWLRAFLIPLISSRGAHLVLASDWMPLRLPYCTDAPGEPHCEIPLPPPTVRQETMLALARDHENVHAFSEPSWLFCSSAETGRAACGGFVPGTHVHAYADHTHIRRAGAMYLKPFVCSRFAEWGFFDEV